MHTLYTVTLNHTYPHSSVYKHTCQNKGTPSVIHTHTRQYTITLASSTLHSAIYPHLSVYKHTCQHKVTLSHMNPHSSVLSQTCRHKITLSHSYTLSSGNSLSCPHTAILVSIHPHSPINDSDQSSSVLPADSYICQQTDTCTNPAAKEPSSLPEPLQIHSQTDPANSHTHSSKPSA